MTTKIRENLADLAHETWSEWMEHLFLQSLENLDGSVTIPADVVARWRRQMVTPYCRLTELEQQSDLNEADKILATLEDTIQLGSSN